MKEYQSQSAQDAQEMKYGDKSYWDYLEKSAFEKADYYRRHGRSDIAKKMIARSLSESLEGNNGE